MTRPSGLAPATTAGSGVSAQLTEYAIGVADVGLSQDIHLLLEHIVDSAVTLLPGVSDAAVLVFPRADFNGGRAAWAERAPAAERGGPVVDGRVDSPVSGIRPGVFPPATPAPPVTQQISGAAQFGQRVTLAVGGDELGQLVLAVPVGGEQPAADLLASFASHSAVAVAAALKVRALSEALLRRDLIGQAKGILMERFALDPESAFAVLRRISMDSNTKLSQVCADVVAGRVLATPAVPVGRAGWPG